MALKTIECQSFLNVDMKEEVPPVLPGIYSPFDQPQNTDIILQSSDRRDFHTRRILLSLGSDVFDSMLTLPQSCGEPQDDPPIIPLAEESDTVYRLLQWIDPRCRPSWELKDMQLVLNAADKYNMQGVMRNIEQVLTKCTEYISADPVQIYAIAIRYGFHDLARIAAKESLHLTLEERTNIQELAFISAEALQHLYIYYFACARAAREVATNFVFSWLGDTCFVWRPNSQRAENHGTPCISIVRENQVWQNWWVEYMGLAAQELYKCPRGLTVKAIPHFAIGPLRTALKCTACRSKVFSDLLVFGDKFDAEVERRISEIALVIT